MSADKAGRIYMERITAVILAGGVGSRMGIDRPKQFIEIDGKPLLYYTIQVFEHNSLVDDIILSVRKEDLEYCREEIVEAYGFKKVRRIVRGGASRAESVLNGLRAIDVCTYVMIHDGARPLVDDDVIESCLDSVRRYKACAAAVPVKDTIKEVNESRKAVCTPDRNRLYQMQTPQTFAYDLIRQAYEKAALKGFEGITDDAMVMEQEGDQPVYICDGSYRNIKVTTPEDLLIMQALQKLQKDVDRNID